MPNRESVAIDAEAVDVGLPCNWLIVNFRHVPVIMSIVCDSVVKWLDM